MGACALGTLIPAAGAQAADFFPTLAAPFTQELYAADLPYAAGIAFATDGDVFTGFAQLGALQRVDAQNTVMEHGSSVHPHSAVLAAHNHFYLGMVNGVNGNVYTNNANGVEEIDATTGQPIGTPISGPGVGNGLGITVDPQTGHLVYAATGGIAWVAPDRSGSGWFSTAGSADGITFDPTGNYLFAASGGNLDVIDRAGTRVQSIALTTPGSSGTDGVAIHAGTPNFVVSVNNSGDITRFDFPGGDYTQPPAQSVFASGGFRGDLTQVASDGCLYLSQGGTRFADGTVNSHLTSTSGSIVKICPGFVPPVTTPTKLIAHPYALGGGGLTLTLTPSATLTSNGDPLAGEQITFKAGSRTICTATTNAAGVARCSVPLAGLLPVLLSGGYDAAFAGNGPLAPASGHAGVL